ncbi:MAG: rod shape-determining protein MreD [Gammaproteobacteria bacterium]
MARSSQVVLLIGSIIIALALSIVPLPQALVWYRPQWVFLVVCYWLLVCPQILGLGWTWVIGLLLDMLTGVTLGEHAFALMIVAYFLLKFHSQLRFSSFAQQMLTIIGLSLLYFGILFAEQGFIGELQHKSLVLMPFFTTILFWPIVYSILQRYFRVYRLYD